MKNNCGNIFKKCIDIKKNNKKKIKTKKRYANILFINNAPTEFTFKQSL